jgi:hypothetical protein
LPAFRRARRSSTRHSGRESAMLSAMSGISDLEIYQRFNAIA